jgi:hypothetical protein
MCVALSADKRPVRPGYQNHSASERYELVSPARHARGARFWLLRLVLFCMLRAPDPSLHRTFTQHDRCSAVSGSGANFW